VGCRAEGAALVVPPGRAQLLEVRCSGLHGGCLHTGPGATAEDVRAFLGWLGPGWRRQANALVIGACLAPWAGSGPGIHHAEPTPHCSPASGGCLGPGGGGSAA
jgi:hypothetical protein